MVSLVKAAVHIQVEGSILYNLSWGWKLAGIDALTHWALEWFGLGMMNISEKSPAVFFILCVWILINFARAILFEARIVKMAWTYLRFWY